MKKFVLSLLGGLLMAPWVHAQQVLVLSPNETASGAGFINNAYNAFSAVAGAGNMVDGRGALGSATPDANLLAGSKVVVIATTYARINPAWVPVLRNAMLNRPDLTFVLFTDGCCETPTNLAPFVNIINEGTGWNLGRSAYINSLISSPLNTNSLYAGSFTGLNPMRGGYYELITNVPSDNALYLANGVTTPPALGTRTNAYAFFVPQQRFNNGQGACTFMTSDVSPFNFSAQFSAIAQSFMHAATDPAGACKQATREPDLAIALAGPANPPVGQPATYTATVTNQGASPSVAGNATINIPPGMTVDTATLPTGCTAAGQTVTCSVNALAAGASQAFAIHVTPTQLVNTPITAAVGAVTGEANTTNNAASLPVASTGAPDLVSSVVPPATLTVGTPATFTLTATNQGNLPSSDGAVTLTIPAGLTADPATLPAGCALAGQVITCQAGALAAGGAQSWPIVLTPTAAGPITLATNVTGVTGEANTGNNGSSVNAAVTATATTVKPVPTLGFWSLLGLSAMLPLFTRRRRRG